MNYKLHQIFSIPNVDQKFEYSLIENNEIKQQSLIRRAIKKYVFKYLNVFSFEELYVKYYNGNVDICQFCNSNYVHIDFTFNLDDNNVMQMIKNKPIKYLCDNKECSSKRKIYNPNSIFFVSKAYHLSEAEANKYILSRNNSPFYFHPEKETKEEYSKRQSRCLDYFIKKYGKDEGTRKFNESHEKTGKGCKYESLVEKYGKEKADSIQKSKAITLQNMIRVHGEEEGKKAYQNWLDKIGFAASYAGMVARHGKEWADNLIAKFSYIRSYEGMLERYGFEETQLKIKNWSYKSSKQYLSTIMDEKQLKEYLHKLASNTFQHFVEKYGEQLGPIKYIQHQHKYFQKRHPKIAENIDGKHVDSFQAYSFFQEVEVEILNEFKNIKSDDIKYADGINRSEYRIDYLNKENKLRWYKLDFTIPKIKLNVEFNGEYYHPKITDDKQYIDNWNKRHKNENAYSLYLKNYENRKYIVNVLHQFKTIEIYDFDVKNHINKQQSIKRIIQFIKEKCL